MLSQFADSEGRATLKDILRDHPGFYPAGRLDYDSEGLLLLTNSGQLQHLIANPKAKMAKTYWVQVEGVADDRALEPLRQGIALKDGPCLPATVSIITEPQVWPRTPPIRQRANSPTSWLEITIREGRNRQVRRMTAAIGLPTLRLIRKQIGSWQLEDLQPGQYRSMTVHAPSKPAPRKKREHKRKRV